MPKPNARRNPGLLPSTGRRPTLLVVGCGDVGLRLLALWRHRGWRVLALTHSPHRVAELRAAGAVPLLGSLDEPATLRRLAGLADAVVHLAPPPGSGLTDPRTVALWRALSRGRRPGRAVLMSTTGVYGDAQGQWVDECRPVQPRTERAQRRVHAERSSRAWARREPGECTLSILRVPGIYALDREGGDPRDRVRRGTPVLVPEEDGYTNHIHADDLARATLLSVFRGRPQRVVQVADEGQWTTGDYYDRVARASGLPPPPRIGWAEAQATLSPMVLSFWGESRRLTTRRMHQELRCRCRVPTVEQALQEGAGLGSGLSARPQGHGGAPALQRPV